MVTLSFEEALGTPPAAGKKSLSFECHHPRQDSSFLSGILAVHIGPARK